MDNPTSLSNAFASSRPAPSASSGADPGITSIYQNNLIRGAAMATPMSDEGREMNIAQTVRALFYRARDARRPMIARWKRNYQVLNNKMWTTRAEPWMPAPEISEIWPIVASMVAWMTDQRPGAETVATAPPFSQFADHYDQLSEQMNALLDAGFAENQEDAEIEKILWDVATYSIGYSKTGWEPWLADGLGDAASRRIDPFTLYPDPHARSMREANFLVEARIMSMDDLNRAFPGAASKVYPGVNEDIDTAPYVGDQQTQPGMPRVNLGPLAPATNYTPYMRSPRGNNALVSEDPVVVVLEAWVRTHKIITHDDDPSIQKGQARVQDRWKCIIVCNNTVLLNKYADEIYAFTCHPYDKMNLFDTGDWYGPCLVEFLTSPQESINRMLGSIEHNLLLLGNPILLEGTKTNIGGRARITNQPGQRLAGRKDEVGFMEPPVIHPDFMNLITFYQEKIVAISGMYAIMRGLESGGRNSSDVVSTLQDSAFVRVRATLRNLERLLRGAGLKKCALISEFYTEPRVVYILGQETGKATSMQLRARHFYTLLSPDDDPETEPQPLTFNLRIDAGSDHPTSRQARQGQAERLYAMGAIDEIALLAAERFPNWATVAGRVMDMKAQAGTLGQPPGARQRARAQ